MKDRIISLTKEDSSFAENILTKEWLVTNGRGGYASGTLPSIITRRYHGFLIAALPEFGRRMMLNELQESITFPEGKCIQLGGEERQSCNLKINGALFIKEFRLEMGLPVWIYEIGEALIERRILLPNKQNTCYIKYKIISSKTPIKLELRPGVNFRNHEEPVNTPLKGPYVLTVIEDRYEISEGQNLPTLKMMVHSKESSFTFSKKVIENVIFRTEESRGYEKIGNIWSPGFFKFELKEEEEATFIASTETFENFAFLSPKEVF